MFLNMDQLEKQLDKEEFQEIESMAAFKVLETQFQMFIKSRIYLDDEYVVMTPNYFLQYTQLEILEFRNTLIQHIESVKKSIDKRALHKREYDSWERHIQTTKEKVDTSKVLDASLVNTESSRIESGKQDTSSSSGNDVDADDADIKPVYDEEPMDEVQLTAEINVFTTGQQHTEQPKFNNEGEVDQNTEQCHDTCPLPAKLTDNQITELLNQSLEFERKPVLQPHRNQSVVRQPIAFKSKRPRISKPRFASQVDVNNDLSKLVTTHYLPKEREYAIVKPHHVIASSESRNSSKNMPRFSSNDMVHNHCLEEAKKKTQERVNSRAKVPSHKTTKRYKPIEQMNVTKKPERQISKGHRWVPTGKIFTSSITKVDSEPTNDDITNQYECEQTLNSSSKLVSKVVPPADKTATSRQELELLFHYYISMLRSTCYTVVAHQDSRIKKAQELKIKTSTNSDIKDNSSKTKLRGRLSESFQDDAKYEHVGQDTRPQGASLQHDKDQRLKNSTTKQSQQVQGSKIQDLTSGIVSLKYVCEHGSSESAGSLALRKIVDLKIKSLT
ncbi:hypothetical protein Tco_0773015 [Tanacetum coccineum]|uniref:Uncharacterized protein n=1 Tax=Tanacetum coccineum TaxID=301880 RepID=A0ABQ4ZJI6_9ASTR